jgi:hypothetical protein
MIVSPLLRHLSSFRTTSFKPDQTSLTAQTFMSTKPSGNANSRIVLSVMSVGIFDALFGHDTQTAQSFFRLWRSDSRSRFNSAFCALK